MAVIQQREGKDDGVCGGRPRANDGCGGGRCRICAAVESALHREHWGYRANVFRDVQDAALCRHFAGGVAGAHAVVAGRSASWRWAGDVEEDCEGRGCGSAAVERREKLERRLTLCDKGHSMLCPCIFVLKGCVSGSRRIGEQ